MILAAMLRLIPLAACALAVCSTTASDPGTPAENAPPRTLVDPSPEWDRPMPFEDEGWYCTSDFPLSCVWSEEALSHAGKFMPGSVPEDRPDKVYCYSGGANADRHCGRTKDRCESFRRGESRLEDTVPCREMTPTEFWRENPRLVEVNRRICDPQECSRGYHWIGAAKIRGEALDLVSGGVEEVEGGMFAAPTKDGRARGYALSTDGDCEYGCEVECPPETSACVGTTCRRCFSGQTVTPQQCEAFIQECEALMLADPDDRRLCTTEGTKRCPKGEECVARYSDAVPEEIRLQGSCRPATP